MTSVLKCSRILIIWNLLSCVNGGIFLEPLSPTVVSSAEGETIFPCQYQVSQGEVIVQVIWNLEKQDGSKEQIITAHYLDGPLESPSYAGRVRFEYSDPIANSALILMNTEVADEGKYTCNIATFPSGKFEAPITLIVQTIPISSLDPVTLVEGQSFRPAATCRSVAKPQPGLSWDTELAGTSQNRSQDNGVTSITFSLHPLRSLNGRRLDCLVWHPTLKSPRRLTNQIVVHYPPDAVVSGYNHNWYVGLEGAMLQCDAKGNPKPHEFTWTRKQGGLPEGVTVQKEFLQFTRPLLLTDQGTYECVATNVVGSGKSDLEITIEESVKPTVHILMLIVIGCAAGILVLVLLVVVMTVNRYHKRKNKQLTMELIEKKEEICTLSRQASIRRVGSVCTDNKYQMDEMTPLRVEGTIRTSLSSLERPRSRDSRSTLGGIAMDALGRPAIFNTSRRGRERQIDRERERESEKEASRLKVESFVRNSHMSLIHPDSHFLPALQPSPYPMDQTIERIRSRNGSAILPADGRPHSGLGSRAGSRVLQSPLSPAYPTLTDEEEGDVSPIDEDSGLPSGHTEADGLDNGGSDTTSSQISDAMSSPFESTNGTLWTKSKPNSVLLVPEPARMPTNHTSIIHHQPQIV
ncbi:nectin-4 isoform X2 [Brachyhypopomus gauderio]|uniref:nectin-4 isoform X2 n=1 Tax=Brachyhypopomus gauderio TaxID=698409 RepID=UPI004042BDF9